MCSLYAAQVSRRYIIGLAVLSEPAALTPCVTSVGTVLGVRRLPQLTLFEDGSKRSTDDALQC